MCLSFKLINFTQPTKCIEVPKYIYFCYKSWLKLLSFFFQTDTYSLYLYDAVLVWAVLVDKLMAVGQDPKNGKEMAKVAVNFMADGNNLILLRVDITLV